MTDSLVLIERHHAVAVVTLNRPEALNALSSALRRRISETFAELSEDRGTEAIILTGAGRAFTVGLDLKELGGEGAASRGARGGTPRMKEASRGARGATPSMEQASQGTHGMPPRQEQANPHLGGADLSDALAATPQPIIAAVNGYAITGGFELALMCDFIIAAPEARFADTHARVGVVPGWGLSQRLPRLIGINRAKELSLTGNYLDAETACAWGLVNRVVPAAELLPVCLSLAKDIASTHRPTRDEIKRIMDSGWQATLAEGLAIEDAASRAHAKAEVRPEKVAQRRAAVQARGREQGNL
ncbi:MAG: enoyl-CoA hydratase [Gammaproteobacteria bacterium]|nr:enoyl-CoA hydratase [Gammaproteobacteria bacterium]